MNPNNQVMFNEQQRREDQWRRASPRPDDPAAEPNGGGGKRATSVRAYHCAVGRTRGRAVTRPIGARCLAQFGERLPVHREGRAERTIWVERPCQNVGVVSAPARLASRTSARRAPRGGEREQNGRDRFPTARPIYRAAWSDLAPAGRGQGPS